MTIPNRPKMPSPFDRTRLKELIKMKRTCSPIDLSIMPQECDQLLNLPPIVRQKEDDDNDEEEIDCGDLFGSKYKKKKKPKHNSTNFHYNLIFSWFNIRYNMFNFFFNIKSNTKSINT